MAQYMVILVNVPWAYKKNVYSSGTGILCFIVFHRYCVLYKLKVCGKPVSSEFTGAIFPTALAHFVSLCHTLTILAIFQNFSLLLYYDTIVMVSVISDVTIAKRL